MVSILENDYIFLFDAWVKVDLGIMLMKRYSIFLKALELEPYHQMAYSHSQDTCCGEVSYPSAEVRLVCLMAPTNKGNKWF